MVMYGTSSSLGRVRRCDKAFAKQYLCQNKEEREAEVEMRDWRQSLDLAIQFLGRGYITEPTHRDYHGYYHMYDGQMGVWNRAYMELAWQVIYDAFLPYYEFTGEAKWLEISERMILDWGIPVVMCSDPDCPAYGGMRINNSPETAGPYGKQYHTFDTGDGLLAFLMVHERTKHPEIARGVRLVSEFLRRATMPDGQLRQCYDLDTDSWSDTVEIFCNSRGAWAYAYWYHLTGDERYRTWACDSATWMLRFQHPNGYVSPKPMEIAEFMIYAIEGLYWAGTYCDIPEFTERAKASFDALVAAEKVAPGNCYYFYNADWSVPEAYHRAAERDHEKDMLSTCGQYAKLAHCFHRLTGDEGYLNEYRDTLEFMYDIQDRRSTDPNMLGGWPRATNHPWRREVCPAYNYVGALLLEPHRVAQ